MPDYRPGPSDAERMRRAVLGRRRNRPDRLSAAAPQPPGKRRPCPNAPTFPSTSRPRPIPEGAAAPTIPADLLKPGVTITLAEVVDIALQNNPVTRASYLAALSAAAQLGSKRAPYYPSVDVFVSGARSNQLSQDPNVSTTGDVYGPASRSTTCCSTWAGGPPTSTTPASASSPPTGATTRRSRT